MQKTINLKKDEVTSNFSGNDFIEKNSYPGGYSTSYERDGYVFETTQLFLRIVSMLRSSVRH